MRRGAGLARRMAPPIFAPMAPGTLALRPATPADLSAVDRLMAASFPRLLKNDYAPSTWVLALPRLARANPALLASGRFYVVQDGADLIGAGGYSLRGPRWAEVRQLATHPAHLRRGVARTILDHVIAAARAEGAVRLDTMATRTAVPFYAALGFAPLGEQVVTLAPGIAFPVMAMARTV